MFEMGERKLGNLEVYGQRLSEGQDVSWWGSELPRGVD